MDTLMLFGEDALQNHYNVIIPAFPNVLALESFNLRVISFELPAQTISTYDIVKRGKKFQRPSGVSEQEKTFTIEYRVDKYYQTYNAIAQWLGYIQNPSSIAMGSDSGLLGAGGLSTFRIPMLVQGLDTNNIITNLWSFTGCFPTEQASISFSEESGDPITVSLTFSYANIYYPGVPI
jgi:hypothetical protein